MNILLKKQNKVSFITLSFLISLSCFSSYVFAQKKSRKTNGRRIASQKNNVVSNGKTTISSKKESETESKDKIDTSKITKYNCEEFYNQCMNKTCYTNANGRCNCSKQATFDKANNSCQYILDVCPSLSSDIIKTFARNASNDCRDFALMKNKGSFKNINNYVAETIACLKPKCRQNKTENFAGCFDEDNFEKRFETCKNTYKDLDDITELKSLVQQSFSDYKKAYCKEMYGNINENGECYLTIGIGRSAFDIKAKKDFKIGDEIVCSSKFFNTSIGENEAKKLAHIKNISLAGVSMVAQGLSTASSVVSSKQKIVESTEKTTASGEKIVKYDVKTVSSSQENTADIISGVLTGAGSGMAVIGDVYGLATQDFSYTGKCFIIYNGVAHDLFVEDETVGYKLRWAKNWDDQIYEK